MPHLRPRAAAWIAAALLLAHPAAAERPAAPAEELPVAGREADWLVGRLQYVAADYDNAVGDGRIVSQAQYDEQVRILGGAASVAGRLGLPPEVMDRLATIRARVEEKRPPLEVYEACRNAISELLPLLWTSMTPPDPAPSERAASIWAARCAPCHGEGGDGRGPEAAGASPPPAAFRDPEIVHLMSPYRAYSAITFGVPGTAMEAHAELSEQERWALAFHVFSFHHGAGAVEEGERAMARAGLGPPPIEESALRTDRDLAAWLGRRLPGDGVPAALAYLRTAGVARAAASPFDGVRRTVREAARAYGADPERAAALAGEASRRFRELAPGVAQRDRLVASGAEDALEDLREVIDDRDAGADVSRAALRAFSALGGAEAALARPPRTGLGPAFQALPVPVQLGLPVALVAALLLAARGRRGRAAAAAAAAGAPAASGAPAARVTPAAPASRGAFPFWAVPLAAGVALAGAFVALQARRGEPGAALAAAPFDLTVKIQAPAEATGGTVVLHLDDRQVTAPIAASEARFEGIPGAFLGRRVQVAASTEPAFEPAWRPSDRLPLTPPVLTLPMRAPAP